MVIFRLLVAVFCINFWVLAFLPVDESSNILRKANLVSISKTTTENDRNVRTKIAAATFGNEISSEKVSGEGVWKQYGFFDSRKSDCGMEKSELSGEYHTVFKSGLSNCQKNQKNLHLWFFYFGTDSGGHKAAWRQFDLCFKRKRSQNDQA